MRGIGDLPFKAGHILDRRARAEEFYDVGARGLAA